MRYFLELCLKSVEAALNGIEAEIIVVDNNSQDDSCQMVKQLFPKVILIENKENYGFSKGNNIGVAKAKGEYLCVLNPDTVVAENTFEKVLEFAESKPNCGIVGCQLIDGSGRFLPESKRQIPTPKVAFQKLRGKTKNYYTRALSPDDVGNTDILVGAFMILKRSVYNEVRGFDEDYFMYGEDIDLSYKVLKTGYDNYYFGESTIIHFKGESTLKNKIYAERFYGAMAIFYKKHFEKYSIVTFLLRQVLKLASKKGRTQNTGEISVDRSIVISKSIYKGLKTKLKRPITFTSSLEEVSNNSQIVFDTQDISYKELIEFMKSNAKTNQNSYRILPKSSNFILGSDSSVSQGEIIHF